MCGTSYMLINYPVLYIICIIDEEIVQIQSISSAYKNGLSVSNSLDFDVLILGISPVLREVVVGSILGFLRRGISERA
jgi:hypothetical protein